MWTPVVMRSRPGLVPTVCSAKSPLVPRPNSDNAAKLAKYLHHVSTRDRIEQLDEPVTTPGPTTDDLARELVERYGEDALARVAELLAPAA